MRVGIVCGYGTNAERLAAFATVIVERAHALRLDLLITSGAATDGGVVTEADVLAELLEPAGVRIVREARARSTAENLLFSRELLAGELVDELTIFCDDIRRMKVAVLSRFVFGRRVRVISAGRQGASWLYLAQIPSTLWQLVRVGCSITNTAVRNRTRTSR